MTGKLEQDHKIQLQIDNILLKCPEFVNNWVTNMQASRKTQVTCINYLRNVYNFLESSFCDPLSVKAEDITSDIIEKYIVNKRTVHKKSGESVRSSDSNQAVSWYAINSLCKYLVKTKKIVENPVDIIDAPPQHDRARIQDEAIYISPRQMKAILKQASLEKSEIKRKRNLAMLRMLASTGIRETAFLNITIDDIDFNNTSVRVIDKGEKYRNVLLDEDTIVLLKEWINVRDKYDKSNSRYLFISQKGERISVAQLYRITSSISNKAIGIKLSPHKFRAFYGTTIYNKTGDIILTKNAMGHSNVTTTQIYIRKSKEDDQKTVDIMKSVLM